MFFKVFKFNYYYILQMINKIIIMDCYIIKFIIIIVFIIDLSILEISDYLTDFIHSFVFIF